MIDWTQSMNQTYEYYVVNPSTWRDGDKIPNVKTASIVRDSTVETLGSATFDVTDLVGECYVRTYLIASQNGITERIPLGTHLVQTPSSSFDGKIRTISMDAYTPLLELKENPPPLGYSIFKGENVMKTAQMIIREHMRAPVVGILSDETLYSDFVANTNDTWLSFNSDLVSYAKYYLDLDEMGRLIFSPKRDTAALQPVWTYTDDNSSILQPDLSTEHDIYGIPNVIEVIYSKNNEHYYSRVVNDDPNSPISTVNRGREIIYRITDPDMVGAPTQEQLDEYAEQQLRNLSTLEYTVTYTHAYCPVRLGDCVRLNYIRAGLVDVKAKVISQNIKCEPGCPVTEKAIYTVKLWR